MLGNRLATTLGIAGALVVLVSLLADVIGLGSGPGFGLVQLSGVAAGILLLAIAVRSRRKAASATVATPTDAG
ncbi:MAG: hypothetical protein OEM96_10770 [Gemmatimonadota bacterium]|nr:hypothetical protein [Gemmatimonadota bacterium]